MKKITLVFALFLLVLLKSSSYAVEVTNFRGLFVRSTDEPVVEVSQPFPSISGNAVVKLCNGAVDDIDGERVSNSVVKINGIMVFDESNFNQNVGTIEKTIYLNEGSENHIECLLKGKPGGSLWIGVIQDVNAESAEILGPDGGVLEVNDTSSPLFGVEVEIPYGALNETKILTIKKVVNPVPFSKGVSGFGAQIDIGPGGTVFNEPILIKFPYDESKLDQFNVLDELSLRILTYNEEYGQWLPVATGGIDTENNIITGSTTHSSIYTVSGDRLIRHKDIQTSNYNPILFIHGLQPVDPVHNIDPYGDIYDTFGDGKFDKNNSALNFLYEEGMNVYGLEYDSSRSIEECAVSLKLALNKIKSQTNSDKVNIIAHSMGGLVSRAYLADMAAASWMNEQQLHSEFLYENDVAKLMMVATPNHGSVLSKLSNIVELTWWENFQSATDMNPSSDFLDTLNEKQIPDSIVVDNIYGVIDSLEGDLTDFINYWSKTDGVVSGYSAQINRDQNVDDLRNYNSFLIQGYFHAMGGKFGWPNGIVKITDINHPVYNLMKSFAFDEDNDGVPDSKDLGPDTPANVKVNSNGMSFSQLKPELLSPQNGSQDFYKDNGIFNWNSVPNPSGNDVEYCMVIKDAYENIFVNMCEQESFIDETTVSWSDFSPGEEYRWAVRARDKNETGSLTQASDWWQFTISPDSDGDTHVAAVDCDDNDPDIHPGALEVCENGIDENCSGSDSPESVCVLNTTITHDSGNKFAFSSRLAGSEINDLRLNLKLLSASGCWYMVTPNFSKPGAVSNSDVYYLPPFGVLNINENMYIGNGQYYHLDLDRSNAGAMSLTAVDVILRGIFSRKLEDFYTLAPAKEFIELVVDTANEYGLVSNLDTATTYLLNGEYISAETGFISFLKKIADEVGHDVIEQKFIAAFDESGVFIWENGLGTIIQIISLPDKYYALKELADYYVLNSGPFSGFVKIEVSGSCTGTECVKIWYKDFDGDGYSDGKSIAQIERPDGYYSADELLSVSGDYNDNDIYTHPTAL